MSKERAKGTRWESRIVGYLRSCGFTHAERRALTGSADCGDITGLPGVVVEAKDENRYRLAEYVTEANRERFNASADVGVAWLHRKGKGSPGDGYVLMDGRQFVELLWAAGYGVRPDDDRPGQMEGAS